MATENDTAGPKLCVRRHQLQTGCIEVFGFRDREFSSVWVRDAETTDLQRLASEMNLTGQRNGAKTNRNLQDMNS